MTPCRETARDLTVIVLAAILLGVTINYKLLSDAWSGRLTASSAPPVAGSSSPLPLPLGLVQVKELFDRKEALIIDARTSESFAAGHIRGAVTLPLGELPGRLPSFTQKFDRQTMIVVYCNGFGCPDSMALGKKLIESGYRQVFLFEGGYPEWRDAGYPVEGNNP